MTNQKKEAHQSSWKSSARRLAVSVGVAFLLFVLLLCGAAGVCYSIDLAPERLAVVSIALTGVGALIAGWLHVRSVRRQGLLQGVIAGTAFYSLLLGTAALLCRSQIGINAVIALLVVLVCSALGGIFAVNRSTHSSDRSKRTAKSRTNGRYG